MSSDQTFIFELGESRDDMRRIEVGSRSLIAALVDLAAILEVAGGGAFSPGHLFMEVTSPEADTVQKQAETEIPHHLARMAARAEPDDVPF